MSRDSQMTFKFPQFLPVWPIYPSGKSGVWVKMSMENWRNDTDRGKRKYSEKHLSQCHFAYKNFHRAGLGVEHVSTALRTQVKI